LCQGQRKECIELYLHSPNMPSWHGAQLIKHRDKFISNFTFTFKNTSDVQEVQ